jgi:hypothetical protein
MQEPDGLPTRAGGRSKLVHLESLGVDHRRARFRGIRLFRAGGIG